MAKYSFNQNPKDVVFASMSGIEASFKDLSAVCDSIRYKNVDKALDSLDAVANGEMPILYRKYNTHMGSRHQLHGKKGRFPEKCAALVRKVLVNAKANAGNKGMAAEDLYVVHASANKTIIIPRFPSKGIISISHGYGYSATRHSDMELARIEIGVGSAAIQGLSKNISNRISASRKREARMKPKEAAKKVQPKAYKKPKSVAKESKPAPQPAEKQVKDNADKMKKDESAEQRNAAPNVQKDENAGA